MIAHARIGSGAETAWKSLADSLDCAPGAALLVAERSTRWEGRATTHVGSSTRAAVA